jgi:ethanolamine ammonia-lyase small subunit
VTGQPPTIDPWQAVRALTPARIGLARTGAALTTRDMLAFDQCCAQARDAIDVALDIDRLEAALPPLPRVHVRSAATDRRTYLRRPDLGRRLSHESANELEQGKYDLVLVIADGLSADAVHLHAPAVVREILSLLTGKTIGPLVIARLARVALADEVGERLDARAVAILIGERPGLTTPDSLGIYLTVAPRRGRTDAERNCISNIHDAGLSPAAAARKLAWLLNEGLRLGFSGVDLKDREENGPAVLPRQGG